ncbi:MAG: glycosyltransferase family 2 protein [Pirellulales bacterium]
MKRSISVFQVLQDCITTLEPAVTELLEVLPELSPRFEVLLIDAGSTDETFEVARDLARSYPQVRIVRQSLQPGLAASLRKALSHSQGEVILLRDEHCETEVHDLRKMWRLIDQYAAVVGRPAALRPAGSGKRSWKQKLSDWGLGRGSATAASCDSTPLHLLHRQVAERLWTSDFAWDEQRAKLSQSGYRWTEIEVRRSSSICSEFDRLGQQIISRRIEIARTDEGTSRPSEPKRIKRSEQIRRFVRGE